MELKVKLLRDFSADIFDQETETTPKGDQEAMKSAFGAQFERQRDK